MISFNFNMNKIEAAIQKSLIAWVKIEYPHIIITTTANEKSYKETAQIGSLGITDLLLFMPPPKEKVLFLELKKMKGKLLESQINWNKEFDNKFLPSVIYSRAVAYGFIEAKHIITTWGNV